MSDKFCAEQLEVFLGKITGVETSEDLTSLIKEARNDYFWEEKSVNSIIEKSKGFSVGEQRLVVGHLLNHLECTLLRGAGDEHKTLYEKLKIVILEHAKTLRFFKK